MDHDLEQEQIEAAALRKELRRARSLLAAELDRMAPEWEVTREIRETLARIDEVLAGKVK
jgi:hypothetical protein